MAKLTLYEIETGLVEVYDAYETVIYDENSTPEECAAVEATLLEYLEAEVKKVDGLAYFMREMSARAAIEKEELDRHKERMARFEAAYERLENWTMGVMLRVGKKKLEGEKNTLTIKKNPASLELTNAAAVPDTYKEYTITLNYQTFMALLEMLIPLGNEEGRLMANHLRGLAKPSVVNALVKARLGQQVECHYCLGSKINLETGDVCGPCDGTGALRATVPGARLITDRVRLELDNPRKKRERKSKEIANGNEAEN